jgi:hypothetical protein
MQTDWRPITDADFRDLLATQTQALSADSKRRFEQTAVAPYLAIIRRSEQYGDEHVWVVAQSDDRVVFFDDVEDEFAIGRIGADRRIGDHGFSGDLTDAMYDFPERLGGPGAE